MSIRPVKRIVQSKPTIEGAGVKLRRAFGFGDTAEIDPFLLLDDFRNDRPERLPRRLPVASASRHRDDHLRARRHGRSRRQPRQPRHARRRRRAVDDRRQRHHASGDAAGRRAGPHARLPALGQPALVAEDDGAALPGRQGAPRFPRSSTTTARACASSAASSGARRARSTASPPIRAISTSSCRRASARRFKVEVERHAFAYVFEGDGTFAYASKPFGVLTEKQVDGEEILFREPAGNRSLVVFDRGDEVTVQAGERGHPLPAGVRQADRGAGRLVRADRDEHAGRAAAGGHRAAQRHVHHRQ